VEQQLRELEAAVSSLLTLALTYGSVHIVTNAETGWVQLSAQKFMPGMVTHDTDDDMMDIAMMISFVCVLI
jgi:hypothetical protein